MVVRGGGATGISPREFGITNQIFLEKPEVGILILINWFDSCNGRFFCRYETHTARSKARTASAQTVTLWQQETVEITRRDHSIIACSRHI